MRNWIAGMACLALTACGGTAQVVPASLSSMVNRSAGTALRSQAAAEPHAIAEFVIHGAGSDALPFSIAAAPDGAMWITEPGTSAIARIAPDGAIRQFRLPTLGGEPEGIVAGPSGTMYFAEHAGPNYATHVAKVTRGGSIIEYNDSNFMPEGVAAGPNGEMWFTQGCAGLAVLARGKVTQYLVSGITGETPAIVRGPDGAMWFSQDGSARIGRVGRDGNLTTYTGLMYESKYNDTPNAVAVGSDGNLWWTAQLSNAIWAMDRHGRIVHVYTIPTPGSAPWGIAAGRDGALWFTEWSGNKVGRVTTGGVFAEYPLPTSNAHPQGIAVDRDGSLWFVESTANRVGRIVP